MTKRNAVTPTRRPKKKMTQPPASMRSPRSSELAAPKNEWGPLLVPSCVVAGFIRWLEENEFCICDMRNGEGVSGAEVMDRFLRDKYLESIS